MEAAVRAVRAVEDVVKLLVFCHPDDDATLRALHRALRRAGRFDAAWLVEFASMPGQSVQRLAEAEDRVTPYFSIIVVHGQGRRP